MIPLGYTGESTCLTGTLTGTCIMVLLHVTVRLLPYSLLHIILSDELEARARLCPALAFGDTLHQVPGTSWMYRELAIVPFVLARIS